MKGRGQTARPSGEKGSPLHEGPRGLEVGSHDSVRLKVGKGWIAKGSKGRIRRLGFFLGAPGSC